MLRIKSALSYYNRIMASSNWPSWRRQKQVPPCRTILVILRESLPDAVERNANVNEQLQSDTRANMRENERY